MDSSALVALVAQTQQQLSQLESTAKALIDELASSGAQATPRLRELLASGERLVAAVTKAGSQLDSQLPEGTAAAAAQANPDRATVDALWQRQAGAGQQEPALLPTPVSQPAGSLAELLSAIAQLPGCTLELLAGRQPAVEAAEATAVLLHCGRAFAAVVHLQSPGSLLPLRVGVLSMAEAEAALSRSGSGGNGSSSASLWAPSQHAVFQQLVALAASALQHFLTQQQHHHQQQPSALELLLLWLATCNDIFSRRSSSGGSLLLADPAAAGGGLLPPLHRPWQLDWQALWQAALNPQLRRAEHVGVV